MKYSTVNLRRVAAGGPSTVYSSGNSGILRFTSKTIQGVGAGSTTFQGQAPRNTVQPPSCPVLNQANPGGNGTVNPQVPYKLSKVGTGSTSSQSQCTTAPPGSLPGCGVQRTFKYQVLDSNGNPIKRGGMPFTDAISTSSPNSCNLGGYTTTPPGQSTDALGQFTETLSICAPACRSGSMCITGCSTGANQTWTVDGVALVNDIKALSYQCNQILVNKQ